MKFNVKYKNKSMKDATSEEIRRFLTKECGLTVKMAKEPISLCIRCFFGDRKHFEVANIPHVTMIPESIDKKVMERHRNALAEKLRNRQEAEEMADENEKRHKADEKVKPNHELKPENRRVARRRKKAEA